MQRNATAWEDPAEEVVATFYIGFGYLAADSSEP
jgi:hypothetical protein